MLKPGDTFERYTIEALIGQGGMGCVYRAYDPRLERRVALKVISDTSAPAAANARLVREARAAAAFDHPNAVAIFDVGELDGAPYIVMELVEGRTLRRLPGDEALPVPTSVGQLSGVARALAAAHKRGLVHRDIKPENVMVREDGMVKVLDFGIARRTSGSVESQRATPTPFQPTLTVEGIRLGTPVYMAPEQIRGDELDGRADQFAWGVLAYELLARKLPWRGAPDPLAMMASTLTDPVDSVALEHAGVSSAVSHVVLRALQKRPEDRFKSMDELQSALEAAERGEASVGALPSMLNKSPAGVTQAQQFSTSEVREVLGQAIEQQSAKQNSVKLGFDDLIEIAAEVGVDVDSLREASRALRVRGDDKRAALAQTAERDAWLQQQRLLFYRHAGIYGIINAALLVLGVLLLSFMPLWIWFIPALAWGVGLAIHGLMAFTSNEHDWLEHNEGMKLWHQDRQHEQALEQAAMRGERHAAALPEPGKARPTSHQRKPARIKAEKLRIANDSNELSQDDQDADHEHHDESAARAKRGDRT